MKKKQKISSDDMRREITDKIITALAKGARPWSRPWNLDPNSGLPVNIVSKKRYSGINVLLLEMNALAFGYRSKYWGTYKQWTEMHGQVRKGQKGTAVVFYKIIEKDEPQQDGTIKKKKIFFLRNYVVFNLDQVDGEKLDKYRVKDKPVEMPPTRIDDFMLPCWEPAKKLIAATGAVIKNGGDRAYYVCPIPKGTFPNHTGGDFIQMPNQNQYPDQAEYFITNFHELSHWSEERLHWNGKYAMNELIAEITACYIAEELKLPNRNMDNHNAYLAGWLKSMEDDPKWIFQASTQASKATDFLLGFNDKQNQVPSEDTEFEPSDAVEVAEQEAA